MYDVKAAQKPITKDLKEALNHFRVIVWIAYAPVAAQTYAGIRLLLHSSCFFFAKALQNLPKDLNLVDLYLHIILCHFPSFFDQHSFQTTSTEYLENLFVTVKRGKHCNNRTKRNILKTTFLRFQTRFLRELSFEDDPEKVLELLEIRPPKNKKNRHFLSFRDVLLSLTDVKLQMPPINDFSEDAKCMRAFINSLLSNKNYNLQLQDGALVLQIRDDLQHYLESTTNQKN